jgi:outer membrane protein assembly factor BamD
MTIGCNKERVNLSRRTAEEQYTEAKRLYDKKKFYKAKLEFRLLVLNNQGNLLIEKAQFYLAETHFMMKEYILAIEEYEKLIRSLPRSEYVDDARYKIGMSYFKLSPHYALDQEYTQKAINQFSQFIEDYPDSELQPLVVARLTDCINKLAKKEYMTADLYRKMRRYKSAVISYDTVMDKYPQTKFAELSLFWKSECLRRMEEFNESEKLFKDFIAKYNGSIFVPQAEEKIKEISTIKNKQPKEASGSIDQ